MTTIGPISQPHINLTFETHRENVSQPINQNADFPQDVNIYALLREMHALLEQLYGSDHAHKTNLALQNLHLQIKNADTVRDTGWWKLGMNFIKPVSMGIVEGLRRTSNIPIVPQNFALVSQSIEGALALYPQYRLTDNEAITKERDAYIHSGHTVQDGVSKELDKFLQMLREIVQSLKEIHSAQHQAIGSTIR